jgi:hypothetical protein
MPGIHLFPPGFMGLKMKSLLLSWRGTEFAGGKESILREHKIAASLYAKS